MKKLMILVLAVLVLTACQQEQRYYSQSDEIDTLKSGIAAYEAGDWDTWQSHFADDAMIFVNSTESVSVSERRAALEEMTAAMASYGFDHENGEFVEMVIDDKGEHWVYYWANHTGTFAATNKSLTIPVHLAMRIEDGKIAAEHIYFDGTEMNAEMVKASGNSSGNGNASSSGNDSSSDGGSNDSMQSANNGISSNNIAVTDVENPPIYPGCENSTEEVRLKCLSDMISKFVDDNFNHDLAMDLGLSGDQNIIVIFDISETGGVTNVKARSKEEGLVEEAERVVNMLPKMQPATKDGQPVAVHYSLPIRFKVEEM